MSGRAAWVFVVLMLSVLPAVGASGSLQAPSGSAGLPPLSERAQAPPQAHWNPTASQAPPVPVIQDGLGPGSAMQQSTGSDGFICTAAFLLRDPTTGIYYLSTAGHCLVRDDADPTPYTGAANPEKMHEQFQVCVADCIDNALGIGTYVTLKPDAAGHPAVYARSGGIGADFGILRLPDEVHDLLRPALPQWGGPTGIGTGATGDLYVHYGHGAYCCEVVGAVATRSPADQGRVAVSLGADDDSFSALGSINGGDSGSAIALGVPSGDVLAGGDAVGVITHGLQGAGVVMSGTVLAKGLKMVREATGLDLELVLAGDPLPRGPTVTAPEPVPDRLAILSPRHGASLDVADKRVRIEGVANATWAAGAQVQVALDDPDFGFDARLPVRGNATWNATWDFAGADLGSHKIRARLVDAAGTILAQHNVTVTLARDIPASSSTTTSRPPSTSSTTTSPRPTGTATSSTGAGNASPIPAPDAAVAVVALAALALVRRRL